MVQRRLSASRKLCAENSPCAARLFRCPCSWAVFIRAGPFSLRMVGQSRCGVETNRETTPPARLGYGIRHRDDITARGVPPCRQSSSQAYWMHPGKSRGTDRIAGPRLVQSRTSMAAENAKGTTKLGKVLPAGQCGG